jgi:hypothetical protein
MVRGRVSRGDARLWIGSLRRGGRRVIDMGFGRLGFEVVGMGMDGGGGDGVGRARMNASSIQR